MGIRVPIARDEKFVAHLLLNEAKKEVDLELVGSILEGTALSKIWDYLSRLGNDVKSVAFDTTGIDRLNSEGVKAWIDFIKRCEARLKIRFKVLGLGFIEQASTVRGVLGRPGVVVERFMAPYHCGRCNEACTRSIPLEAVGIREGHFLPPALSCDQCAGPLKFDDIESEYFEFLRRNLPKP
jgi:ABC-type transporter Mla MlaB component